MLFSVVPTNACCGIVTTWLRSPDFRSAQSRTTLAAAILVKLPTCNFFLGSCSSKMYPVCASAMTYACAAAAERTKAAGAQLPSKMIRNFRGRCINDPERQHVNRHVLIRKRLRTRCLLSHFSAVFGRD